jgi:hypothetical protein
MKTRVGRYLLGWGMALGLMLGGAVEGRVQQRDYLSELEADRIRDAEHPNERIKLFLEFAADRLKKFHYERARTVPDRNRAARLNSLLEAYSGCADDVTDLLQLGRTKQQDIHKGIKLAQTKLKEYLAELEKIAASPDTEPFKEALTDAMEATKSAQAEADKAAREIAPPPVRRKQ